MRRNLPLRILLAAGLLALALVGLVAREGYARASGREVVLAMQAFDPRSLLTGHYAALQLADRMAAGAACEYSERDSWIQLRMEGGRHRVAGVSRTRAAAERAGAVAVRGRVYCVSMAAPEAPPLARLEIGIDRFHADQEEAERIEAMLRPGPATGAPEAFAVVSVGRDGRARLKAIIVGGRRLELSWF